MNGNTQPQRQHCIIEKLGGYDGLPVRYFVRSIDGWFSEHGFTSELKLAYIFTTFEDAIARIERDYPAGATIIQS